MATSNENDFSDLKALYLNCTLKRSPKSSHTQNLMDKSIEIMEANGVSVEHLRPVDYDLPPGMSLDMSEEGYDKDDWPDIQQKVLDSDILVIGSPIWLGQKSSVCKNVIERLYAYSGKLNDKKQSIYYGQVGGSIVTGNEDGYKHNGSYILYSLQHIGFLVPPQTDTGWVGPAGPGPSYGDEGDNGPVGYDNKFTNQTTRIMTWNLMHLAKMVKDSGGIPIHGNQRSK
ncbi:MAG TPA: flavodoxin family protein [Balneolaceae bacterium]